MKRNIALTVCLTLLILAAVGTTGASGAPPDKNPSLAGLTVTVDHALIQRHRALGRLSSVATGVATPRLTVENTGSFGWGDAMIGAGCGFGLTLIAGGTLFFWRRRRDGRIQPV
jgi:hypothetical protein